MPTLINFNGQTVFKVGVSETLTIPETRTIDSPTDNANFDSIRGVAGGQLLTTFDDVTGAVVQFSGTADQIRLYPGDIVACGAVGTPAANNVVVTITSRDGTVRTFTLLGVTADAGVIGIHG